MGRQERWADLDSCNRFHPPTDKEEEPPDPDRFYEEHREQMMDDRAERGV